jgi:hypothetical protein
VDPEDLVQLNRNLEFWALREQMAEMRAETEARMAEHEAFMEHARAHGYEERPPAPPSPPHTRQVEEPVMHYRRTENALAPASAPMDPVTQAGWDNWAKAHIRNGIDEFGEVVAEFGALMRDDMRKEFKAEIETLRTELATLRESIGGKVVIIPPAKGRDDAA